MTYEIFDPYEGVPVDVELAKWLEQQGWTEFLGIGGEELGLRIRSYWRRVEGRDEFIAEVSDANQGSPFVKVDNFGVLMDLFARWAPAVQASALASLIEDIEAYHLSSAGVVETVAAKVAYGAVEGLEDLRRDQRERAARRREIAEQRRAARGAGDA